MSAISFVKCTCPHCNKEVEIAVEGSINLMFDKDLVDLLFNEDIFVHMCTECKRDFKVYHKILVNSMSMPTAQFVWFDPYDEVTAEDRNNVAELMKSVLKGSVNMVNLPTTYVFKDIEEFKLAVQQCLDGEAVSPARIRILSTLGKTNNKKVVVLEEVKGFGEKEDEVLVREFPDGSKREFKLAHMTVEDLMAGDSDN